MCAARLLERTSLIELLRSHLESASLGHGGLLLIGGEAGVGKSSLIDHFRRRHSGDAIVLWGACEAMSAPRPLGPILDFAHELGSEFARLAHSGSDRGRLFSELLADLRAEDTLHLVVLEDLHWADDATLDLVRYLGRRIADARALVIGSYRDDELGATHPLRQVFGDLAGSEALHRMEVEPLTLAAVTELAEGSGLDPLELHRRTAGNAFFVSEVLAAGGSRVPTKVADAVMARVSRLTADAISAMEMASIIGHNADLDLLTRLIPSPEAVDECVSAGLLASRRNTYSFRHELAREAVVESIPTTRRRRAHALVLAELERRAAQAGDAPAESGHGDVASTATAQATSDTVVTNTDSAEATSDTVVTNTDWAEARTAQVAVLAHHSFEAGDVNAVLRYAPAAALAAYRLRAYREALTQAARALAYADAIDPQTRVTLYETHAFSCFFADHQEESVASFRAVVQLYDELGDLEHKGSTLFTLCQALCIMCRDEEAFEVLAELEAMLEDTPQSRLHAAVYFIHGWKSYENGDGLAWLRLAEKTATRFGDARRALQARSLAGLALASSGRVGAARHEAESALVAATECGQEGIGPTIAHSLGNGLIESYRLRAAQRAYEQALALNRQYYDEGGGNSILSYQALAALRAGRWAEAEEVALSVVARSRVLTQASMRAHLTLGLLHLRRGDGDYSEYLDPVARLTRPKARLAQVVTLRSARAEAAMAVNDSETALREASADYARITAHGNVWQLSELAYWIWRAGGDPQLPDAIETPYSWQVRGDPERAARRWARLECPYEQAIALRDTGVAEQVKRALELFAALGAERAVAETRAVLRRLGIRHVPRGPRSTTRASPAGLTEREQEVLVLLARGLRNADIATHNNVSPRTVDHQVSAVLGKLGVRSRSEAVAEAHRLGLLRASD